MIIIFTIMSIIAAVYVSHGRSLIANCIWAISNIGFVYHNIVISEYEMAILFMAYEIIAVYGVYNLKLKQHFKEHTR